LSQQLEMLVMDEAKQQLFICIKDWRTHHPPKTLRKNRPTKKKGDTNEEDAAKTIQANVRKRNAKKGQKAKKGAKSKKGGKKSAKKKKQQETEPEEELDEQDKAALAIQNRVRIRNAKKEKEKRVKKKKADEAKDKKRAGEEKNIVSCCVRSCIRPCIHLPDLIVKPCIDM
jgi:hypothetical protein